VAIGGINAANVTRVRSTGVAGICAISAILGPSDTAAACRALRATAQ